MYNVATVASLFKPFIYISVHQIIWSSKRTVWKMNRKGYERAHGLLDLLLLLDITLWKLRLNDSAGEFSKLLHALILDMYVIYVLVSDNAWIFKGPFYFTFKNKPLCLYYLYVCTCLCVVRGGGGDYHFYYNKHAQHVNSLLKQMHSEIFLFYCWLAKLETRSKMLYKLKVK